MDARTIIGMISVGVPAVSSVSCTLLILMLRLEKSYEENRELQRLMLAYFFIFSVKFLSGIAYQWYPNSYTLLAPLVYSSFTLVMVLFYQLIYRLTDKGENSRFPWAHYLLPVLLPLILIVWSFWVPFDVRLQIVEQMGKPAADYPLFSAFFTSFMLTEIIFSAVYLPMAYRRLRHYRQSLSKKERNNKRLSMRWLTMLVILNILISTTFICIIIISRRAFLTSEILPLWAVLVVALQMVFMYNILKNNYPPVELHILPRRKAEPVNTPHKVTKPIEEQSTASPARLKSSVRTAAGEHEEVSTLTRNQFETWFRREKPYLDPELKLTTMAAALGCSRTALSVFINTTYEVNFNTYIGRWRLKELKQLQKKKENQSRTLKSLLAEAGFGSYHSYMRLIQQVNDNKTSNNKEK